MNRFFPFNFADGSAIARAFIGLIILSAPVLAQGTERADLLGTVRDSNGAAIAGAKLTATNVATNVSSSATSDENGNYAFRFLPAGRYQITAEMSGFATITITDIVLQVNINATVPIILKPGAVTETITITADGNRIDTTDATVKHSVTSEQVRGLPVFTSTLGRTVLDQLAFLVPGVHPTSTFGSDIRGEQISINGSRPSSVSFNFEGGDNNDHEFSRAASPLPNPDALQEFTVVTNSYKADLGRSSGGVINAQAKSGTNRYHGNVRYFLINEALNARSFFDPAVPRRRLNTFGGNIGGPVVLPRLFKGKDRTHFFFDYEGTRSRRDNLFNRDLISNGERTGDFSNLPAAQQPIDPLTRQPFPGGIIPASRISLVAREYLDRYIPRPNNGERNFSVLLPTEDYNNQFTTRIDHKMSASDSLSATYFYTRSSTIQSSTTNLPVGSTQDGLRENHNFIFRQTHIFSARTVNQFTGNLTRYNDEFRFRSPGADGVHPRDIGITGVNPQTNNFLGVPTVTISGTGVQISTGGGTSSFKTSWQFKDDLSHTRGNHALKFGGEARGFIFNKYLGNNNGSFNFSSANAFGTRNSIADFLLGIPNSFGQNTGNILYPRQKAYYFYGMDDWQPAPNLTINLGLRYELVPTLKDELDQLNVFRPGQRSQRLPQAPVGVLFVGDPDPILGTVPRGGYPTDKNNFAPRLGIAYSPKLQLGWLRRLLGDGRGAVRIGWGVFYDQTYGFSFTQYSFTQPFSVSQTLAANQINAAGGHFANPFGSLPNPWPLDLSERIFTGTPTLQPFDPSFRTAYTYQYNLTIQRELPWSLLLELAYIGNNSFKLNRERELNIATVGPGATVGNVQARRIFPHLGSIPSQESSGRARYDSFQARLTRRFKTGLFFDGSYVFAKGLDNGSNPQVSQLVLTDPFRWARSSNDRTHNFVVSYTYDLPSPRRSRALERILGGWRIGGVTQFRSGLPMDISQLGDTTLTGRVIGGRGNPDLVGPFAKLDPRNYQTIVVNGAPQSGNFFFDPNAFQVVTIADFTQARAGTLGRNVFDGPGLNSWSASILKRMRLAETHEIEFRSDISNLFNHAQFGVPGLIAGTATFGKVPFAAPGRNIQMSLRYTF